jgi:hypothetical protein
MSGPASLTMMDDSVSAMQSPLNIGKNLRLDEFGAMGIKEPAKGFDYGLLFVGHPAIANQLRYALGQPIRTFHAQSLHNSILN